MSIKPFPWGQLPILLGILGCSLSSYAQTINVTVSGENNAAVRNATIVLRRADDHKVVELAISDSMGKSILPYRAAGRYEILVSHLGYDSARSPSFEAVLADTAYDLSFALRRRSAVLKSAEVVARKPLIEVEADKIILNVEGSILATGLNAFELLQRSPGVTADNNGNLSLMGLNGVAIYVDGRLSRLGGRDLADYLKGIQASQVSAIEIIRNPSAKYDAAGSAGVINIRLLKNRNYGTNGSLNAGYNIGDLPKYYGGVSLNHRDEKINIYANYSYNHGKYDGFNNVLRSVSDTTFNQHVTADISNAVHSFNGGVDYTINKRISIGAVVNGLFLDNSLNTNSLTSIVYNKTGVTDRNLVAGGSTSNSKKLGNWNLNFRYEDPSGHSLGVDADYGKYTMKSDQFQPNSYYDPVKDTLISSDDYSTRSPSTIEIFGLKTDYEQNFLKGKLGLGGKASWVNSNNDFLQYRGFGDTMKLDDLNSDHFRYRENINAAYFNYNRRFKGGALQAGLRMENTNISGTSHAYSQTDSSFKRHYTNFFPSASFTLNGNPNAQWTISYSYRIDRPSYRDLNPFSFRIDDYSFRRGNTNLQPQYTHSVGVTFVSHQKWVTTVNYARTVNMIAVLTDTEDVVKTFISKKNLATQNTVSLTSSYNATFKWYSLFGNFNLYYADYKGNFGPGRVLSLNNIAYSLNVRQSFALGRDWSAELSGFYNSPAIIRGTFKNHQIWTVDAGIRKSLWDRKLILSVSGSDLFNSLLNRTTVDFAGQHVVEEGKDETRMLKVNITYRFGSNKIKGPRQHRSGVDEEGRRVN